MRFYFLCHESGIVYQFHKPITPGKPALTVSTQDSNPSTGSPSPPGHSMLCVLEKPVGSRPAVPLASGQMHAPPPSWMTQKQWVEWIDSKLKIYLLKWKGKTDSISRWKKQCCGSGRIRNIWTDPDMMRNKSVKKSLIFWPNTVP